MGKYWDVEKTASYNCLLNFIMGIRGCGKTYGLLQYLVNRYLKHEYRFMYVRRSEEELKALTTMKSGRLFNHVQTEFEGHSLWTEANVLHVDKEVCGYAQAVSTARKLKSDALDNVRDIVFDEFIIDNTISSQRYLPSEVTAFFELYESIARPGSRDYDVRCWFLGNAISSTNQYFDFFKLTMPFNTDIKRDGDKLLQLVAPPELIEAKKSTRFYKTIEGSDYAAYAAENKFLRDRESFIAKKDSKCEYQYTMLYYDDSIGVWRDYRNGRYFISDDVDKQCRTVYACTTESHEPNVLLMKGFKGSRQLKNLKEAYDKGCLFYENQRLYNWFRDIVRMAL